MNSWIDLPNLSSFTIGYGSFRETTSLDLSSIYHSLFLSSTDVPFKNGKYTHGQKEGVDPPFESLSRSSIQSDSSISFSPFIYFIHSLIKSQTTNIISFEDWKGE